MSKDFYLKYHATHIRSIFNALVNVFEKKDFADKALEKEMRAHKRWDVRERSFVATVTYDIIRNWRLLLAASKTEGKLTENNLWNIFGTYLIFDGYDLPESGNFKKINEKKVISQYNT